jgi:RHH-type transcriptional regulator, rel operon repressor / antitoxin RelB
MLGVRLDAEMDRRLAAIARRQRRSKSDVAREALQAFIARQDDQAEFVRQVKLAAEYDLTSEGQEEMEFLDRLVADLLDDDELADESYVTHQPTTLK